DPPRRQAVHPLWRGGQLGRLRLRADRVAARPDVTPRAHPRNSPPSTPRTMLPSTPPPRALPNTCFETWLATSRPSAELAERVADLTARFHGERAASRSAAMRARSASRT